MLVKEQVMAAVQALPDSFSVDELFDRVILLEKIQRGLKQSESGALKNMDEAKTRLKKWLQ